MSLLNDLLAQHGTTLVSKLSKELNLDSAQATGALDAVGPLLVNGLKKQQDNAGGGVLQDLIAKMGVSEETLAHLEQGSQSLQEQSSSESTISQLLGGGSKLGEAQQALSQKLGVDSGKAGQIMTTLAPVIMSFLMKKGKQDPHTPDRLSGMSALLDRDGDGSALDDIAGLLMGGSSSQGGGGGLLGSLLKGLKGGPK